MGAGSSVEQAYRVEGEPTSEVANKVHQTQVVKKNLNPVWDEQFELGVVCATDSIRFEVMDHDGVMRDDHLGHCELLLGSLNRAKTTHTLPVVTGKDEHACAHKGNASTLTVEIELVLPGSPAAVAADAAKEEVTGAAAEGEAEKFWTVGIGLGCVGATAKVTIARATELPAGDINGLSDPYVKLLLQKSGAHENTKAKAKASDGASHRVLTAAAAAEAQHEVEMNAFRLLAKEYEKRGKCVAQEDFFALKDMWVKLMNGEELEEEALTWREKLSPEQLKDKRAEIIGCVLRFQVRRRGH
jgi:hypothetical protein